MVSLIAQKEKMHRRQCKMSSSKVTWRGTLRQLFICLRPPPHLGFWLGVVEQFCRFRICSNTSTKCKTPTVYALQHLIPPYTPYTYLYTIHIPVLIRTRKGGSVEPERRGEGQQTCPQISSANRNSVNLRT
jgi:hypothetical protein